MYIIALLLLVVRLDAQSPVTPAGSASVAGKITDSLTGHALEYATITLLDKKTGKTVTGTTSNNAGLFSMDNIAVGDYQLLVEFIGYRKFIRNNVSITKKAAILDVKNIQLSKDAKVLSGVTVDCSGKIN